MIAVDPEGLVGFEAGGAKYVAVFGFRAMKAVETHFDRPFLQAVASAMPALALEDVNDPKKVAEAASNIRLTDVGTLFQCALLKHHPTLTDGDVEDLIDEIGLAMASEIIGKSLRAALQEGDDSSPKNPPHKSRERKTGSRSSRSGPAPA